MPAFANKRCYVRNDKETHLRGDGKNNLSLVIRHL